MTGRLKDLTFGRNGEQLITLTVKADARELFDSLKDYDIDIEIKKHRKKRSLDANAYCWLLSSKIADKIKSTKNEVYRQAIKDVGTFRDLPGMTLDDAAIVREIWETKGVGWVTEIVDTSYDGREVTVRLYDGSSTYNTEQMSRLIDILIQECNSLNITTVTPEEAVRMGMTDRGEKR